MERWRSGKREYNPATKNYSTVVREGKRVEVPEIDVFLAEIAEVCKKHDMSIGHEDGHGAFIIGRLADHDGWIDGAFDEWSKDE